MVQLCHPENIAITWCCQIPCGYVSIRIANYEPEGDRTGEEGNHYNDQQQNNGYDAIQEVQWRAQAHTAERWKQVRQGRRIYKRILCSDCKCISEALEKIGKI